MQNVISYEMNAIRDQSMRRCIRNEILSSHKLKFCNIEKPLAVFFASFILMITLQIEYSSEYTWTLLNCLYFLDRFHYKIFKDILLKSKINIFANVGFIFQFFIRCRSRGESIDQIGNRSFVMDMNGGSRHHNHPFPPATPSHQSLSNGGAREQWTKMPEPQNGLEHHQVNSIFLIDTTAYIHLFIFRSH